MGNCAVVVGGGIVGISAAYLLSRNFANVILIEMSDHLGGLYSSLSFQDRYSFDYGYHLAGDIGFKELDNFLYGSPYDFEWNSFPYLRGGSYFKGQLNRKSPGINARTLSDESYREGLSGFVGASEGQEFTNLLERLTAQYGEIFAQQIMIPAANKQYKCALSALHPDSNQFVGTKLCCFEEQETRELLQTDQYGGLIASHDASDKASEILFYYPQEGGIGRWIEVLEERLEGANVEILKNTRVESAEHTDGVLNEIALDNGRRVNADHLVWTAPLAQLLKSSGVGGNHQDLKLQRQVSTFYHLVCDRPVITDNHSVVCYDQDICFDRLTLYENLQSAREGEDGYRLTAEIVSPVSQSPELTNRVFSDLQSMKIVNQDARLLHSLVHSVGQSFPIPTNQFVQNTISLDSICRDTLSNVSLFGMATGVKFVMFQLLREMYRELRGTFPLEAEQQALFHDIAPVETFVPPSRN